MVELIHDVGIELVNGENQCGLDRAHELVCMFESTEHACCAPDRSNGRTVLDASIPLIAAHNHVT